MRYVPVVDCNNKPLMPCHPARARELLKKKRAMYFWRNGIFCIKMLDRDLKDSVTQPVAVGIDPGSKREGSTVKSRHHTYLHIQSKAVDWVKEKVETRRMYRRGRRYHNAPYRKCRPNRQIHDTRVPPSTKARWQAKLRILNILKTIFPIDYIIFEDIAAKSKKGQRKWNVSFSPLEVGKKWFFEQANKIAPVYKRKGYHTKQMRDDFGLKKSSKKLSNEFNAHCVDSWVLANSAVGGHIEPDNKEIMLWNPLKRNRRNLHDAVPKKGGVRRSRSSQPIWPKGALVKWGNVICLVGGIGVGKNAVSLNDMENKRIKRSISVRKLTLLDRYNKWGHCYA
jgi:hypothetical protein